MEITCWCLTDSKKLLFAFYEFSNTNTATKFWLLKYLYCINNFPKGKDSRCKWFKPQASKHQHCGTSIMAFRNFFSPSPWYAFVGWLLFFWCSYKFLSLSISYHANSLPLGFNYPNLLFYWLLKIWNTYFKKMRTNTLFLKSLRN